MTGFDAPRALALGAAIVVAANAWLLGTARHNRAGEPEARLALTERELAMPLSRERDDTGLLLSIALADRPPEAVARVAWLAGRRPRPIGHAWLDAGKLRSLGFDPAAIEAAARDPRPGGDGGAREVRSAFLVLEYEGPAWDAWLAAREADVAKLRVEAERGQADRGTLAEAEALLAVDRTSRSRLMPVDAGLDPEALRARYADRTRYAVVPGFVAARVQVGEGGRAELSGTIERTAVGEISVPHRLLARLTPFAPRADASEVNRRLRDDAAASRSPAATPPRYRATLAYGRGLDPWLVDATPLPRD